jgi:hypothetical protein
MWAHMHRSAAAERAMWTHMHRSAAAEGAMWTHMHRSAAAGARDRSPHASIRGCGRRDVGPHASIRSVWGPAGARIGAGAAVGSACGPLAAGAARAVGSTATPRGCTVLHHSHIPTPDGAPLEHLNERHSSALAQRALHHLELRLRGVPTLSDLAPETRAPILGRGVQSGNNSGSELFVVGPVKTLPDKVIKRGHAYGLAAVCVTNHVRRTQVLQKVRLLKYSPTQTNCGTDSRRVRIRSQERRPAFPCRRRQPTAKSQPLLNPLSSTGWSFRTARHKARSTHERS